MKIFTIITLLLVFFAALSCVTADNVHPRVGEAEEPILTNRYAVHARGVHPKLLAARHGLEHQISMRTRDDLHIFQAKNSSFIPLSQSSEVLWFEQQISRKQYKRSVTVNDPLYYSQWHLHDDYTADLNLQTAWDLGFNGRNVLIAVVDDGLDYQHPEVAASYVSDASFDVNFQDHDVLPGTYDTHGSEAAGVAMGIQNNQICGSGVAPAAKVAGIRLLAANTEDWEEAEALQYRNDLVDIYSNSWGPYDDGTRLEGPGPLTQAALVNSTLSGRRGLGSIFVWAAGNGKSLGDNCNYDGYANSKYTIAVAAIGYDGKTVFYSEPGAPLVVSAPSSDTSHSISTSATSSKCATNFGGTSASCPMVAGVVALMLQANPNLTWRDVQAILIQTATKNDPGHSDWVTNGAGLHVNHNYGYGKVDATAAVLLAQTWTNLPAYHTISSSLMTRNLRIPDHSETSTTWECTTALIVEHVEITVNIHHPLRGQLEITLISPSGTSSTLAEQHNDSNNSYTNWKFSSMRTWGESSRGVWTLVIRDTVLTGVGTLNDWTLEISGHLA